MKKKLDQYNGNLSVQDIAAGINASRKNALRLAEDARLLFENGCYPSAVALSILAIEESGKTSILREMAIAEENVEVQRIWKKYRSHTAKNTMWIFPHLVASGARRLDEFKSLVEEGSEHPFLLDQIKQVSFYTDCLGKKHWSIPGEVIDANLAKSILETAQILSKGDEVTIREIELWVKHMKPVKGADFGWQKKSLANWYSGMQAEGLAPEGENEMERFIYKGIGEIKKTD
jgi:AbiV family abortive infection protein